MLVEKERTNLKLISEAHVGFGIFGKEGRNAARCSDFAIAKFKFIRRALFVHGFLYYTRLTILVHYFFYKVYFLSALIFE
jgi:phospholipid-translocating ATPase